MTDKEFVAKLLPLLQKYCPPIGLNPVFALSQAWLETAHGSSEIFALTGGPWNLTTGGSWTPFVERQSKEYDKQGKLYITKIKYRKYSTLEESVKDYVKLLASSYLDNRKPETIEEFAGIVAGNNAGKRKFATAPGYAAAVVNTHNKIVVPFLTKYSNEAGAFSGGGSIGLLAIAGVALGVLFAR